MLQEIIEAIKEKEKCVFYGSVDPGDLDGEKWNYVVITKDKTENENGRWFDQFIITIVREGYIPEGYPLEVMELVEKAHVRAGSTVTYGYYEKGSTGEIIETATFKARGVRRSCF